MKFHQEFIELARFIEAKYPTHFARAYPRRILTPSDNYGSPHLYAASLSAVLALGDTNYNSRNAVVAGIDICAQKLVNHRVPTFFIHEGLLRALLATDVSEDFKFADLHWPFEAMLFCLPLNVMSEIFPLPVPWISIARVPMGKIRVGKSFDAIIEKERVAMHYPVFGDPRVGEDFGGLFPTEVTLREHFAAKPFYADQLALDITKSDNLSVVPPEVDELIVRRVTTLAVLVILGMLAAPQYIESGTMIRKASTNPKKAQDELWSPNLIGFKYRPQTRSGGRGEGQTHRFFARRGHLRNQIYGRMRDEQGALIPAKERPHQVIWIEPITDEEKN